MDHEQWTKVKAGFLQVIDSDQPPESFDQLSNDPSLEFEVRALVASFQQAQQRSFLEVPVSELLGSTREFDDSVLDTESVVDADATLAPARHPERIGRFEVVGEPLGQGSFGTAYRAQDNLGGRVVAIKVPHFGKTRPSDFIREARAAAALSHPNIVTIYEVNKNEIGVPYIVMELMEGGTLKDRLRGSPLPWQEAVDIAIAVAEGLACGHQKFIHRDLKPGNILFDGQGTPKIADFGLALEYESQHGVQESVAGTVPYMSPEHLRGQKLDDRADIYSLGVILYEMLVGKRPFEGRDIKGQILRDEPRPVRQYRADIPKELSAICHSCLQKLPDNRPDTAADLTRQLRKVRERHGDHQGAVRRKVLLSAVPLGIAIATGTFFWKRQGTEGKQREGKSGPSGVTPAKQDVKEPGAGRIRPSIAVAAGVLGESFFNINEVANSLVLVSDDLCLLRYGIVDEETTSLAVTVEPNEYGMEAGLFVGLRDVKIGELRQFQRIGIVLTDDDRLWLRQAIQDFHPRSPSSRNTHPKPSQTFPSQTAVHRLFVGMKKGQVTRITLDDVELDMTTPFLEADASALGVFGVFVTEKSAKFSDFELDNNLQTLIDD